MKTSRLLVLLPALVALLSGCASSYRVGTTLAPELRDTCVPKIVNSSKEPNLDQEVTKALLREIQRDGTLNLVDEQFARTAIEIEVVQFDMSALAYRTNDKHTGSEYRGTITASVVFRDRRDNKILYRRSLTGYKDFPVAGDVTSAKRRVFPEASKKLAENIVNECISLW